MRLSLLLTSVVGLLALPRNSNGTSFVFTADRAGDVSNVRFPTDPVTDFTSIAPVVYNGVIHLNGSIAIVGESASYQGKRKQGAGGLIEYDLDGVAGGSFSFNRSALVGKSAQATLKIYGSGIPIITYHEGLIEFDNSSVLGKHRSAFSRIRNHRKGLRKHHKKNRDEEDDDDNVDDELSEAIDGSDGEAKRKRRALRRPMTKGKMKAFFAKKWHERKSDDDEVDDVSEEIDGTETKGKRRDLRRPMQKGKMKAFFAKKWHERKSDEDDDDNVDDVSEEIDGTDAEVDGTKEKRDLKRPKPSVKAFFPKARDSMKKWHERKSERKSERKARKGDRKSERPAKN